ncbi:response regulator [Cohnella sp. CFH 77786]|uniref:response regulator n=1 Tax=Cohnella sp. CFH 77786 TaxID=2662265 RepID=UPI001C609135|nr:response regulator [Cohnella sp. CFH 77786]MBW5445402.1 response regulator [Cohnella sp. CFH 77786]
MKRILITDDSAIMRRNLRAILSNAGYEVVAEAADGEEALQAYRKYLPDLVTMDITMPVMDGLETVKRIIREYPGARIVVISAFDQRRMLFEAMENGAKHYLIKPITADKLLSAVRQQLEPSPVPVSEPVAAGSPERPATSSLTAEGPGFDIENKDGMFTISFADPMRPGPYADLRTAVQGLLFVKPINIAFHFGDAQGCHPALADELEALIGTIRQAGGNAFAGARNETLAAALRNRLSVPIGAEGRSG